MSGGGRQNWKNMQNVVRRELLNDSEHDTDSRHSATEIEGFLTEKLKDINRHDYKAIDSHRKSIQDALSQEFEIERINFGGSHARSTDVRHLSDIDLLASFRNESALPSSSSEAIALLAQRLRERFPRSSIETGNMAVTVRFTDGIEVQVLPAYRDSNTYSIPDANSSGWQTSNPTAFSKKLSQINAKCNRQVVPAVKLIKSLLKGNDINLKSYHIENLAAKAFEYFNGPYSQRNLVRHFLNSGKILVQQHIADPAGQSHDVSNYLSRQDRIKISKKLASLELKLRSDALDSWSDAFGT